MVKCKQCGMQSEIERAFVEVKSGSGRKPRWYCPECYQKRNQGKLKESMIWMGMTAVVGALMVAATPANPGGWILVSMALYVLYGIPLIVLHELGHALMGRWLNFRVLAVVLGIGKPIWSFRWRGIRCSVRALPLGGATALSSAEAKNYRLRKFLCVLAGPATHLLWIFLLLALMNLPLWEQMSGLGRYLLWALLGTNAVLLAANLLPSRSVSAFGPIQSDGGQLLKIFSKSDAELNESFAQHYAYQSWDATEQKDLPAAQRWVQEGLARFPGHVALVNVRGVVEFAAGDYTAARETFARLLQSQPDMPPETKYIVYNNVACANVLLDDPALLPEADSLSVEAYQNAPWVPQVVGTRGAVLVSLGQVEEGVDLLKDAMKKHTSAPEKAVEACFIAIGEAKRGNLAEAQAYLAEARRLDADCRVLPRAGAACQAAQTGAAA